MMYDDTMLDPDDVNAFLDVCERLAEDTDESLFDIGWLLLKYTPAQVSTAAEVAAACGVDILMALERDDT